MATALREVRQQTGWRCVCEAIVGVSEDVDSRGHPMLVRYWAMCSVAGAFTPTHEVDAIAWVRPSEAFLRLTRDSESPAPERRNHATRCARGAGRPCPLAVFGLTPRQTSPPRPATIRPAGQPH
jgi:hypothetical protein